MSIVVLMGLSQTGKAMAFEVGENACYGVS